MCRAHSRRTKATALLSPLRRGLCSSLILRTTQPDAAGLMGLASAQYPRRALCALILVD